MIVFFKTISFHWHKAQERGGEKEVYLKDDGNPLNLIFFPSRLHNFYNAFMLLQNEIK